MKISKLLKARENANEQDAIDFLVLNLIGWEDSATVLEQSQRKGK